MKKTYYLIGTISFTLFFLIAAYVGYAYYIKKVGIKLESTFDVEAKNNVVYFLQNDPKWKDDSMGNSGLTLGGYGCLVSSLASSLSYYQITQDSKQINHLFNEKNVFTPGGEVIWYKINEVYPGIDYKYKRVFTSRTIMKDLNSNILPIVKVRYKKTGIFHWVLIVGSKDDDFLIMDPLNSQKQFTKLNKEHGKVYAYRTLIKNID